MEEKLKQIEEAIKFLGNDITFSIQSDGNGYGLLVLQHWNWQDDSTTSVAVSNRDITSYTNGFLEAAHQMREKLGFSD